jgi:hypothetical protein
MAFWAVLWDFVLQSHRVVCHNRICGGGRCAELSREAMVTSLQPVCCCRSDSPCCHKCDSHRTNICRFCLHLPLLLMLLLNPRV